MRVRVSAIIPSYGRPQFLGDALASVFAQTRAVDEIIVVDDASPEPIVVRDARVLVIRAETNGGPAATRNLGVRHAQGEVIAFLDDDDTWSPQHIAGAIEALRGAPVAISWQSPVGRRLEGNVHGVILDRLTPSLGATIIRRTSWLDMDETYPAVEDLVWWLDVSAVSDVATNPVQGLFVRRHSGEHRGYGSRARIDASHRLLVERADYFAEHRNALAFRWKRIGLMQMDLGDSSSARRSFLRALRASPSLADIKHFFGTMR